MSSSLPRLAADPHYYTSPLHMGRYGLSSAAGNALISQLTSPLGSEGATARRAFLDLMRSGGNGYPLEILSRAGADLESPRTIEVPIARLESLVDELERAIDPDHRFQSGATARN